MPCHARGMSGERVAFVKRICKLFLEGYENGLWVRIKNRFITPTTEAFA